MRSVALEGDLFCFGVIMDGKANDCSSKVFVFQALSLRKGLGNLGILFFFFFFYESRLYPGIENKILNINLLFHEWISVEGAIYS